ncbi:MAG: hypothetical protein GVY25_00665 [Bacteroidetes bacterium]|nr:hypothetical protein [Bacteroidota bacterium]
MALGVSHDQVQLSVAYLLFKERTFAETVRSTDVHGLDLLTGSLELANADILLK